MRPAAAGDERFLRDLYATTRRDEFAPFGWSPATFESFLDSQFGARRAHYAAHYPHATQSVILVEEIPVGQLTLERAAESIHVIDLSVLPGHRGQGLGTAVLKMLQAAAAGVPIRLSVWHDNPAGRLYARLGFAERSADAVYRHLEWPAPLPATD